MQTNANTKSDPNKQHAHSNKKLSYCW